MTEASPFDTEEALVESIKGIFAGNDKTRFGHAFHKLIEDEYQFVGGRYVADGIIFTREQAIPAIRYKLLHPQIICEIPIQKLYETRYGVVQVSGRIDANEGLAVRDAKARFRNVVFKDYESSSQWKFYLDMLDAQVFYYDAFEVKGFDGFHGRRAPLDVPASVSVTPHEPFQCLRYPGMEEEITSLLNLFMDYIDNRNFFHLLKPANEEAIDF